MEKLDKIYYINLDRRPERNAHFIGECLRQNLPFEKVERYVAVDGYVYRPTEEELWMFNIADFQFDITVNRLMANQLSHYNLLKKIIENNYEYAIICQDDVMFIDNFVEHIDNILANIPEDAEIINFGFHKVACMSKFVPWTFGEPAPYVGKKMNDYVCKMYRTFESYFNPCSLAYIVTKKGARNLVDYFDTVGFLRATDWNYNDYLSSKDICYASNEILATGNNCFVSDVF